MTSPLANLVKVGTKLWLDSVDPDLITKNRTLGATGATSNPIIISGLIKTGRYDNLLDSLQSESTSSTHEIAWALTDRIVAEAQKEFITIWEETNGDDGYVSFEVDPLLEDPGNQISHAQRVQQYIELGTKWSQGHKNRMIKVPATPAGLEALEELAARGIPLNITLIFTQRQYEAARESVWRGAQRLDSLEHFKSVYSIFVSRVDVYTQKHIPELSADAQGQVGILNAKLMWKHNQEFWKQNSTPLKQEIIFASTGVKSKVDPAWKYVAELAGSDIQTNPPGTNDAVESSGISIAKRVDQLPSDAICSEIEAKVDMQKLEDTLMEEGIEKFAEPQKALLEMLDKKLAANA